MRSPNALGATKTHVGGEYYICLSSLEQGYCASSCVCGQHDSDLQRRGADREERVMVLNLG